MKLQEARQLGVGRKDGRGRALKIAKRVPKNGGQTGVIRLGLRAEFGVGLAQVVGVRPLFHEMLHQQRN